MKLVRALRAGDLSPVHVPIVEDEGMRLDERLIRSVRPTANIEDDRLPAEAGGQRTFIKFPITR